MKISMELKAQAYTSISKKAKEYHKTIDEILSDTDRDNPVKLNLLQAQQRMFSEEVFEIIRKTKVKAKGESK